MKTLTTFLAAVAFLLSMQTTAGAVCLEVEMNICHEEFVHSDIAKRGLDAAERMASEEPENATLSTQLINSRLLFEQGYQYSHPAILLVNLDDDGWIKEYRLDFPNPVLAILDPSFSADDVPLKYDNRKTVIRNAEQQLYVAEWSMDTHELRSEELSSSPNSFEAGESWYGAYVLFEEVVKEGKSPTLTTSSFKRYEIARGDGVTIDISTDGSEVRLYYGNVEHPLSYCVIRLTRYNGHDFPWMIEQWVRNVCKKTFYFNDKRILDDEKEARELLTIPEAGS